MNQVEEIIFRQASEDDVREIISLAFSEMDGYLTVAYNGPFNWAKWESELRETIYDQNHSTPLQKSSIVNQFTKVLIFELFEETIGFVWFSYYSDEIIWIDSIILKPDFQRKGLGKYIMSRLESDFSKIFKYIDLGVQEENKRAKKFYSNIGFYKLDDIAMSYYLTEHMRKKIEIED